MEQCKECEQRKFAQVANTSNAPKEEDYPGTEPYPGTARAGVLKGLLGLGVPVEFNPVPENPYLDPRYTLRLRVDNLRARANRLEALILGLPPQMNALAEEALRELVRKLDHD